MAASRSVDTEQQPVPNLTEAGLRRYLELFHQNYVETADALLPEDLRQKLLRYPLARGRVVGYASTQFGAAFEYFGGTEPILETQRSSSRIEYLFSGAPPAVRSLPALFVTAPNQPVGDDVQFLHPGTLREVTLKDGFPIWLTDSTGAIRLVSVRFQVPAANWERTVLLADLYGDRTAPSWSEVKAISRAKDELLLAVLQVREAEKRNLSLADYLAGPKQRMVLILGDYSAEGERRLRMIVAEILQDLGYDPVLMKDIPEHPQYDLQQKVVAVGSVSRFIVVDDSSRSGHILEVGRVQDNRWVAIVMRLEDSHGTFMTQGLGVTSRVIREESYTPATLRAVLQGAATWAEERVADLQRSYAEVYPWRGSGESHSP